MNDTPREIEIDETEEQDAGRNPPREADAGEAGDPEAGRHTVATEQVEEEIDEELIALQDRLLRLQAEFDNYRKREARERAAAWGRAKADLAQKLLGAIDDLSRVAHLDPAATPAQAVIDGIQLVERKLYETLGREGMTPIGEPGEPFDPEHHEAIGIWPAPTPEQDGTVAVVARRGFRFGNQLLRPAQVQVYEHRPEGAGAAPSEPAGGGAPGPEA